MSWRRFALCKDSVHVDLHCLNLNGPPWMMLNLLPWFLEWPLILKLKFKRSRCWIYSIAVFPKREVEAIFSKHKLQLALLNSAWVSDSILNVDWLYFHMWRMLYAKLIGRIALFTCENIAHIEFYLQGLLPKILAIYTIKVITSLKLSQLSLITIIFKSVILCP